MVKHRATEPFTVGGQFDWPPTMDEDPVLAYDTRDWAGGAAIPTTETNPAIDCGDIPNTGTAGSAYDIPMWVLMREDWFGPGQGLWVISRCQVRTDTAQDPFTMPSTYWDDLGGVPMSRPWTMFVEATPTTDPQPAVSGMLRRCVLQQFNNTSPFPSFDLERWTESFASGNRGELAVFLQSFNANSTNWIPVTPFGVPFAPAMLTNIADVRSGVLRVFHDYADVTETDTLRTPERTIDDTDALVFAASGPFDPPEHCRIGMSEGEGFSQAPVKGNPVEGITQFRIYRGVPTREDMERVATEMGL